MSSNPSCFDQLLPSPSLSSFENHMASQSLLLIGEVSCYCLLFSFLLLFLGHSHESSLGSAKFSHILQDRRLSNAKTVVSSTQGSHLHLAGSGMEDVFCLEGKKARQVIRLGEALACCQDHPGKGRRILRKEENQVFYIFQHWKYSECAFKTWEEKTASSVSVNGNHTGRSLPL